MNIEALLTPEALVEHFYVLTDELREEVFTKLSRAGEQ